MVASRATAHFDLQDVLALGPPAAGNLAVSVFAHGSLEVELYAPVGSDLQQPHERDEIYVVARGSGDFFDGEKVRPVVPGTFLFVAAGQPHRFERFSEDFAVWVFFYGPNGGEQPESP
ncbi:MAG: cupin domain-containing protein [Planctomycetota bacterium]